MIDPTGLPRVGLGEVRRFAVVSDVHVRAPDDDRAGALVACLASLGPERVDAVFLLGDVFDFIYARSRYQRALWRGVFAALESLRARGVKVHFVEGNHDFGFEHGLPAELAGAFDSAGDRVMELLHPVLGRVWLRHGDDVVCPESYARFRSVVKARWFQRAGGVVPGIVTHALFSGYARLSRGKDEYRALEPSFFRACLRRYFDALGAGGHPRPKMLVLGHVHLNVDCLFEAVRVVAGPDWFSVPSVLLVNEAGAVSRHWLKPGVHAPEYPLA